MQKTKIIKLIVFCAFIFVFGSCQRASEGKISNVYKAFKVLRAEPTEQNALNYMTELEKFYESSYRKSLENSLESSYQKDTDLLIENQNCFDRLVLLSTDIYDSIKVCDEEVYKTSIIETMRCLEDLCIQNTLRLEKTVSDYTNMYVVSVIFLLIFSICVIALNIRENRRLKNDYDETKKYLKHVIKAQESERNRISLELHDTVAQSLKAILLELPENLKEKQRNCIIEIRNLCYKLAPTDVQNGEIKNALAMLCGKSKLKNNSEVHLIMQNDFSFDSFDTDKLLNIYRIIQEGVNNIVNHSNAENASVMIRKVINKGEDYLCIYITDDGVGINQNILKQYNTQGFYTDGTESHFGLRGIRERTLLLDGELSIKSTEDTGTEIKIMMKM